MVSSGCPLEVTAQYIVLALFSRLTFALVRELTQAGS